jgi:hypothetical protein
MWRFLLLAAVGAALVAGAVLSDRARQREQAYDVRSIEGMQTMLDSVRVLYAVAPTASDSARLQAEIGKRVYGIGRWQYHVPLRQRAIDSWWTTTGVGTWLVVAGIVLMLGGLSSAIARYRRG